ncbi:MAG: response regulator [bacterium]|nr:response regulator [Myxococcales bacterium]MCB9551752.1 response regulator [Myxococcales bacterium]
MAEVLIIEDDRFNRRVYRDLLEAEGFAVRLAASAAEGIDAARAAPPALVVMDVELPGMSGLEATRRLKGDARTRAVPVLIISAHAMEGADKAATRAGADAFLCKPLRFPDFQRTVQKLIEGAAAALDGAGGLRRNVR